MTKFKKGDEVMLNLINSFNVGHRQYHGVLAKVDFQCKATCGVLGIVYVNFVPNGKRKEVSIAFHQDALTLAN